MKGEIIYAILGLALLACRVHSARRVDASSRLAKALAVREAQSPLVRSLGDRMAVRDLLGLDQDTELKEVEETRTVQGTKIIKMVETYRGYPVFDETIVVERGSKGQGIIDARGTFLEDIQEDMANEDWRISSEEALNLVLREAGNEDLRQEIFQVLVRKELFPTESDHVVPGYFVQFMLVTEDIVRQPTAMVDANLGTVMRLWNNLNSYKRREQKIALIGGNKKTGKIIYGTAPFIMNLTRNGDTCYMKNEFVQVVDNNKTMDMNETSDVISFPCTDRYDDEINGAFSPAVDVLFSGTVLGKMLREWYNATPLESIPILRVHYGNNTQNAFFTGKYGYFGDGDGETLYPLATLDIVAHEIGHGMVERYSNLLYINESGGINEAFADITGEVTDFYMGQADWVVGAGVSVKEPALRYFADPRRDNNSIESLDEYEPGMDVHFSSGVFNRMFYLLVKTRSLGVRETYGVLMQANRFYWHALSDMNSAACDLLQAAYDLGQPVDIWSRCQAEVSITPCDVSKHIMTLRYEQPYFDIKVSQNIQPLFRVEYPAFLPEAVLKLTAGGIEDIRIQLLEDSCVTEIQPGCVLAEGINELQYSVVGQWQALVRLSTSSADTSLITLLVDAHTENQKSDS